MSVKTLEILEQLKSLTLNETAQLVKQIEATFNVDISTPKLIRVDKRDEDEVQPQIQTEFDVLLVSVPPEKKIALLKVIRTVTGLGLKEAKDFVDSLPQVVQAGLDREAAEILKQQLEEAGGVVSLK
ncbi:50S ribosomal protein L7/L12 [Nostocaceae cyanobacterium CENA369]|jgi:large subunit ribosomal protein L7/L12|uniref:Large ribosomal subunit protein bL12 n=1 Tax=Dendronalium phyllosphericum CENA369 TaxID=1725256 RepID=A0A8J7I4U9_9NOST|nr:50S ribosomal protein L7/L12 [Dendronalium phyllosphericum]MBH8574038.1 50S ribosomal protein L7/L12 [Dendronalium phyllosphericum CENA369]